MYGSEGYANCSVAWLLSSARTVPRYHLPFGAKNLDWLQVLQGRVRQEYGLQTACQSTELTCIDAAKLALHCLADWAGYWLLAHTQPTPAAFLVVRQAVLHIAADRVIRYTQGYKAGSIRLDRLWIKAGCKAAEPAAVVVKDPHQASRISLAETPSALEPAAATLLAPTAQTLQFPNKP